MKSRSEQDGTSPFKADEGNGGPGRDEAVIGPSGAGRDAAQAPASPAGPSAVEEVGRLSRTGSTKTILRMALRHAEELDQWRRLGLIPSDVAQELTVRAPA